MPGLLVVDDTAIIRSTIAKIVVRENLNLSPVFEAENGEEAMRLARQHQPDIIFMDIKMPGVNGLQATQAIREESPNSKIVILTAYDEFSYVQEALKLGAVDYLLKPVRPNKLIEVITQVQTIIQKEQTRQQILTETQKRLEKALPLIEANLVDELVYRQTRDPVGVEITLEQLRKTVSMPVVMVLSIDDFNKIIKRFKPETLLQHYNAITQTVYKILEPAPQTLLGQWQLGQLVIILSTGNQWETVNAQKALGETLRQRIASQGHFTVTVSFGHRYAELDSIPVSYAEARLAQRHTSSGNCVIHIDETNVNSQQQGYIYPLALEKELLENVRIKQEDICLELMNGIVDDMLYKYKRDPQTLYSYFAELLTLISRTVIEIGASAPEVFDLSHRQMAVLFSAPSPAQLRAWALNSLTDLLGIFELKIEHSNQDAAQLAIEYIHKNHHNPDISLHDVAHAVGLSISHLAFLLKERTGTSYSKYLASLRIKNAKKLLRTTPMTVSAIAEAVGYPNATNFYRIFQRETNQTPNEYRQSKLQ